MIRAVHEFFCASGPCREVRLADGRHYPVLLSIEQMLAGLAMPGRAGTHAPGLRIKYRGHEEDLVALGCVSRERLAAARRGRSRDDSRGAPLHVESKAAPGRRRMIELSYFAQSRTFAGILPGVRTYCADWLEALAARPMLRLVVDNSRAQLPHSRAVKNAATR